MLCILSLLLLIGNFVFLLCYFIFIAIIVSTCILPMFLPIPATQPTELMSTHLAGHMITSLIFFNWAWTFWTTLCVCHYPCYIFTLSRILHCPGLANFTCRRAMGFTATLEAEAVPALTQDILYSTEIKEFNTIIASFIWAPTDTLIIICIRFIIPFFISPKIIRMFLQHW